MSSHDYPTTCVECGYSLDGFQPDAAIVCPECGVRQAPGDRERLAERRLFLLAKGIMAPWAVPVALCMFLGWLNTGWAYLLIGLAMMLAPLKSAGMSLSVLVRHRRPRMTASQWIAYPSMWVFGTVVGLGFCWAVLSMATLSRQ